MSLKKKLKKAAKFAGAAYLASKALSGAGAGAGINVDKRIKPKIQKTI